MLLTSAAAIALSLASVGVHYEALRLGSFAAAQPRIPPRLRVALAVVVALVAHMVEAVLFALGWALLIEAGVATFSLPVMNADDVMYFSLITYTSLGYGDIVPLGPSRLLAGVESLVGLVLIAWTASFTYLEMRRYWPNDWD